MKNLNFLLTALLTIAALFPMNAAENTSTGIFDPKFRTITTDVSGNRLAPPVITLGSADQLHIGFDCMSEDREFLRYSIYHCNSRWEPSNLVDAEVFDGFNYADITDYAFSRATSTHYVHYSITLPNADFQFRISGNYLLKVYPENDPEKTLLQVRFMVSEGAVGIRGNATSRTDIDYNGSNQQLEFRVDLNRYPVRDAFNDLAICITQNGRTDNPAIVTHPSRMEGNTLVYEHLPQLIFPAGNEYRRMETVQMQYPGMRIDHIDYFAPYYHHFVELDKPRHSSLYTYDSTQHGRYFIREYNADDSDTEADYSVVHFVLDMLPVPGADVYIEGDFTNRRFDESSKMAYDSEAGVYHKEMLLKQGAYNYQYLTLPSGVQHDTKRRDATPLNNGVNAKASSAVTEGNFYQTVNEYLVTVYYRAPGERYDRLLGCTLIYSGE